MSIQQKKLSNLYSMVKNMEKSSDEGSKKILEGILDLIKDLYDEIEKLQINQETMEENLELIDKDIAGIQDDIFEEVTIDELDALDDSKDEYVEIKCDKCNKEIYIEKSVLDKKENIPCPYCDNIIIV
ncbi:CD1247 N-terminal domain-containing protein [Clostridium fallax]|uniref:Uncharacterized protein n=1 Tax=Clostridium fallax TaxID=1533 RepID=A0A1M4XNS0_9CLOT|nr:CD1247 N-terminal domain-containing protein [Clostridium fallax]SHE94913.1 hypothetical protein SAMN05443638_11946 [Clostridium fallax]SQB06336.1 Uncharacterised protein [Clostridium fallax]